MSGSQHNVITKRAYTFTSLAVGGSQTIVLVRAINILDAKSLELVVRVHAITVGGNALLSVKAYPISLTSEDPGTDFRGASVASVTLPPSGGVSLGLANLSTPFGHMVQITLEAAQDAAVSQTITATLSIDLVARDN